MVTIRAWTPDGQLHVIKAPQTGKAFDQADAIGAIRVADSHGCVYRKLSGEWVDMLVTGEAPWCPEEGPGRSAGKSERRHEVGIKEAIEWI